MAFELTSSAFEHEETIPDKYGCDEDNVPPALSWSEPPADTESFVLIFDDPDAPGGTFTHWVIFNLPADTHDLPEGLVSNQNLPGEAKLGENSRGLTGYAGPCPPGETHRYFFRLYALDTTLDLSLGATRDEVEAAMEGHVLADGELMGTFTRETEL